MNLTDLASTLPNGFHDAEVQSFEMDYVHRVLRFRMDVWTSGVEDVGRRELYRPAVLSLREVAYLAIEVPDEKYPWREAGPVSIDVGSGCPAKSAFMPPEVPPNITKSWFFIVDFNCFLHCGAAEAQLEWVGEERVRE